MLYDPARHESLHRAPWNEQRAWDTIERIVRDTEARFAPASHWPIHPKDADAGDTGPLFPLYFGAAGVVWALHYLQAVGAAHLHRSYADYVESLRSLNRDWLRADGSAAFASYLMGDTGILLLAHWLNPSGQTAAQLEALIAGNLDHPSRELMWGAPGSLLAALFLHERTSDERWAELYCAAARKLWSQLRWSPEYQCRYWTQDMYGRTSTYLGGVHGFVATAAPLIRGRHLMAPGEWDEWERCIAQTIARTALQEAHRVNWPTLLSEPEGRRVPLLMQFCHGAPGFVVCLADLPGTALDDLLLGAGETIWEAGPLRKGSNLCHGTGGNGYAFLRLYQRTRDALWLERARAFAMRAIAQTETNATRYGQMRYSLWTGDPGLAIYLRDCIRGVGAFPTLDVFFASGASLAADKRGPR